MNAHERLTMCANSLLVIIDGIACVLSMLWQKKIHSRYMSGKIDDLLEIRTIIKEIQEEMDEECEGG